MKRLLSTALAVTLLLSLGALAVLARGGGDILTPVRIAPVALAAAQPQTAAAPDADGPKYNAIALALDNGKNLASTLLADINATSGATALQVLKWDPDTGYTIYDPLDDPPEDFTILVGDPVFVLMQGTSTTTYSIVGDVPDEGSVSFALVGNATTCKYNFISLPLDQGSITMAGQLATAIDAVSPIGGVSQVLAWDPTTGYTIYDPSEPEEDFSVQIGYPYFVCMTASKTWPAP